MRVRLHHIGIAVRNLGEGIEPWTRGLGLSAGPIEEVPTERVRAAFLTVGDTRLELLEPTADSSPIARFLVRRGEGIHHLCIEVERLEEALTQLRKAGVPLIDEGPRPGASGSRVAFVHPRGMGGVLLELRERGVPEKQR